MHQEGHTFTEDNVKILDINSRWLQRGIKEAYNLAVKEPNLNHDQGCQYLPTVYKTLIKSCDHDSLGESHT